MELLDPDLGGRFRAVITVISNAVSASLVVAGQADHVWAVILIIAFTAISSIIQILTHGTNIGNVDELNVAG